VRATLQARCPDAVFAGFALAAMTWRRTTRRAMSVLFPSVTETFGNVTPEAMASGLAVLAFDHAAAGQLIEHGENGWLAQGADAGVLVQLARSLAHEPAALRRAGAAARRSALELGWDGIVRQVETVFVSALIAHRSQDPSSALLARWGPT
jgi:glycosyltransferase involved in cell wall biosynthesis